MRVIITTKQKRKDLIIIIIQNLTWFEKMTFFRIKKNQKGEEVKKQIEERSYEKGEKIIKEKKRENKRYNLVKIKERKF